MRPPNRISRRTLNDPAPSYSTREWTSSECRREISGGGIGRFSVDGGGQPPIVDHRRRLPWILLHHIDRSFHFLLRPQTVFKEKGYDHLNVFGWIGRCV